MDATSAMNKSDRVLLLMISGTFFGFTLAAYLVHLLISDESFLIVLTPHIPIMNQIAGGSFLGAVAAGISVFLMMKIVYFQPLRDFSYDLYRMMRPSIGTIFMISAAAGWGEELFFRGILQPRIGLLLTSLIFAGIHTGFDPRTRVKRQYFGMVFIVSLGLGLISKHIGLYAAMCAHCLWDIVVLMTYRIIEIRHSKVGYSSANQNMQPEAAPGQCMPGPGQGEV